MIAFEQVCHRYALHEGRVAQLARPRELMLEAPPPSVSRLLEVPRHQLEWLEALRR